MPLARRFAPMLTFLLVTPLHADAQASRFLTGVGYGVVGAAAGIAVTAGASCDGFLCIPGEMVAATLLGAGAGTLVGATTAASANRAIAEGSALGDGRVGVIAVGTVLGGATLGALGGALLINGAGSGTPLGSDERTVAVCTLAGATLAFLQLRRNWGALTGQVDVRPVVTLDGRVGMAARVRF